MQLQYRQFIFVNILQKALADRYYTDLDFIALNTNAMK